MCKAVEAAGADAISLTNTFQACAIDLEKRRPVIDTPPLQPQCVPHQVEQGGFPRPVAAIEDGDGFHLQTGFLPRPKDAKRVNILVTSPAVDRFSQRKLLVGLGRQSKTG